MPGWRERRLGPLLTMWAAATAFLAALMWLQHEQPALDDIFPLFYVLTGIVLAWSTIKWVRARPSRRTDRRQTDRRATDHHDNKTTREL